MTIQLVMEMIKHSRSWDDSIRDGCRDSSRLLLTLKAARGTITFAMAVVRGRRFRLRCSARCKKVAASGTIARVAVIHERAARRTNHLVMIIILEIM